MTLPIRTGIKTVLLCLSLIWFSIKLAWTITLLIPLFFYMGFVLSTSFILAAAHADPALVEQLSNVLPFRQLRFALCVLMAAMTEVPHYAILLKVVVFLSVKITGTLNHGFGYLFMLIDLANIAFLFYNWAQNFQSTQFLIHHFKTDSSDPRFSLATLLPKSLSLSYQVQDTNKLNIYSGVKYYDTEALRDPSIAALQKREEGLLDIYTYRDASSRGALKPVIVYAHGGAWTMGSKTLPTPFYKIMAEAGFVVVTLNYRLAPRYPQPAGFQDIMLGLDWTRKNIAAFGGDRDFIVMAGDSAGGHLAQLATLTAAERGAPVQGSILFYPVVDVMDEFGMDAPRKRFFINTVCGGDAEAAATLGLVRHIDSGVAKSPVLVFHGEYDSLVKHASVVEMQRRLRQAGSEMDLVSLQGAHHAYTVFNSARSIATCYHSADWAMKLYNAQKKAQ